MMAAGQAPLLLKSQLVQARDISVNHTIISSSSSNQQRYLSDFYFKEQVVEQNTSFDLIFFAVEIRLEYF